MADWDDVRRVALALPQVTEVPSSSGALGWRVGSRPAFAWERRLRPGELASLQVPPTGPLLAVRTADLEDKEALLAEGLPGVVRFPHFEGYPAVLVDLALVAAPVLAELVEDAWLARAPVRLRRTWLEGAGRAAEG